MYFEIGTRFIITDKPSYWNSRLNGKSPLISRTIKYPYKGVITKLLKIEDNEVAMTDGKYGWSLTTLINEKLIEIDILEERRIKLKKIKNGIQNRREI